MNSDLGGFLLVSMERAVATPHPPLSLVNASARVTKIQRPEDNSTHCGDVLRRPQIFTDLRLAGATTRLGNRGALARRLVHRSVMSKLKRQLVRFECSRLARSSEIRTVIQSSPALGADTLQGLHGLAKEVIPNEAPVHPNWQSLTVKRPITEMAPRLAKETEWPAKGAFINNKWTPVEGARTINVFAPAEGRVFAKIAASSPNDVDRAVKAARHAFEEGAWGRLTATDRGRLLMKLGEAIADHAEELAVLEARDTGKPMKQARADMVAAARYFEYYGGAADKLHGETIPFLQGYFVAGERGPFGVTGHIIPWNYPAQMLGRTLGPALAMGNATVMKPAEDACLTPLRIAELSAVVGFPDGAINIVPGSGIEAGASLAEHPGLDFIAFTGSPDIGVFIQTAAARNHISCVLELGGKSPQIVFGDADLDAAVPVLVNAIVQNAGQTCSAGSRILIEKSHYGAVMERVADRFKKLRAGTPDMDLDLGPVINLKQKKRVEAFVAKAEADGVTLIASGQVVAGVPKDGFYVEPRLYGPVPRSNTLALDEVFGPVLSAIPFEDEADAVRLANGTDFGLIAAVWSRDGAKATRVARKVNAGQVYINSYGAGGGVELPFGGRRKSGHGREKGFEALYEFSTLKTIINKHD